VRESELLKHIYGRSAKLPSRFPQVLVGPGHDCAVVQSGSPVLLKIDQLVAGRHYRDGTPLDLIARKAIARAVSDIAASGGTPLAALAGATLPDAYPHANELFDAMARWAEHFGCPLVGGDIATSSAPGSPLVLSVSIIGSPHASRGPVLRSGAIPGDGVFITGAVGGSFDPTTGLGPHLTFEPRLAEAKFLCDTLGPRLRAMMDVSDGLGRDAGRLASMSGVAIELEESALPLRTPGLPWRAAVGDGEDYELLFAAAGEVPPRCPATGTPLTPIGTVKSGSGATIVLRDGTRVDVSALGWDHGMGAQTA
jgi:thiamine-monophosphate kinase